MSAVFEEVPPVRSDGIELDVVVHVFAGSREEIAKKLWKGENGWAEVEGVAVFGKVVELAADLIVFFKDLDLVACGAQRDGSGEPAEAGADDCDFRSFHYVPSSLGA